MPGQGQSRQSIQSGNAQRARQSRPRQPKPPSAADVNAATIPRPNRRVVRVSRPQHRRERQQSRAQSYRSKPHRYKPVTAPVGAPRQAPKRPSKYVQGPTYHLIKVHNGKVTKAASLQRQQAARLAPVLNVLNQLSRGYHATAGAADELVKGHGLGAAAHGFKEGALHLKHAKSFSDVLKDAGVKNKTVRSIGGFVGDVALDPSTYVTGGAGSIAAKEAEKAGAAAAKKALAKGLTEEQAKRFGERAAKQAAGKASKVKGATVKLAGKEVPGVRKATAHASRPVRAAGRAVVPARTRASVRAVGADLNPNVAPTGIAEEANRKAIQAVRTTRAKVSHGVHTAQLQGRGIKKQIGEKNYQQVIDALEAGKVGSLPKELRGHAVTIRSQLRYANRLRKQAGIRGGERANYVPHHINPEVLAVERKAAKRGVGGRTIRPSSAMQRKEERSLAELRHAKPGRYSENLAQITASRMAEGHTSVARAELNRIIAGMGRKLPKRGEPLTLRNDEAVFHVQGSNISELTDKEAARVAEKGGKNGRYVILSRDVEKRARAAVPELKGPGIVHALDKTTAGFKTLATATPGFHLRNIVGDLQNAYLGQSARHMPANMLRAGKVLKAYGRHEKSLLHLAPQDVGKATLKTKRYGAITYDEAAKRLRDAGAFRSGYIAQELPELAHSGELAAERGTIRKVHVPEKLKRAALAREDLPRLTTAMQALRGGATFEEAAQRVADLHFDYQHLTDFERQVMRRAMPFYTWSARNIPLQTKKLVTNPGKYAHYQALREEATKGSGVDQQTKQVRDLYAQLKAAGVKLPGGWEKQLSEWEQRNAGVPLSIGGHKFTLSTGLPLQDLSEAPGAALGNQLNEYYQKGMSLTGPLPKDLIEYFDNHSFFFRDQLERDNSPLVAAPSWASKLPSQIQKWAHVTHIIDKKSGKRVLAWRGKADYVFKSVPGTPNYVNQFLTQGTDRRGKSLGGKVLGYLGVKSVPVDPVRNAMDLAYARQHEIEVELAALHQQGVNKSHPTPQYRKLNEQLRIVNRIAYQAKAQQGYKVLPKTGGPPRGGSGNAAYDFSGPSGGMYDFSGSSGGATYDFSH